jgi:hypothetical protein
MKAIYKKRLLKAADIVEKVPREEFDMSDYQFSCGAPACVLGHYAAATRKHIGMFIFDSDDYFGVNSEEWFELFDSQGCGRAKTPKQAAKYIRQFVKRKEAEL